MKKTEARRLAITLGVLILAALFAWAGSSDTVEWSGVPLYAVVVAAAFIVQWLVYIPSQIFHTERFFDLTGSLTYSLITLGVLAANEDRGVRATVLGVLVIVWAVRLGSFLFIRISKDKSDSRFDEIKKSPMRFFNVWTIQGLWITVTASAAWIAISSNNQSKPDVLFYVGICIWVVGFAFEVIADAQKRRFRARTDKTEPFITSGLWAWSQHPNYFGEVAMWTGIALVALGNLSGWQLIGLMSPVFVYVLLTKVSGIPTLEAKAETKWGDDPAYQAYKARTSILFPMPPRRK